MISRMLNPDNYTVTVHAASSMLVGAAIAVLGIYVLIKEHGSRIGLVFWMFAVCISIWLVGFGLVAASPEQNQALWWMRLALVDVVFIPAVILLLALSVVERTRQFRKLLRVSIVLSALFAVSVVFTGQYISGVYHYSWGYSPKYGPAGVAFIFYFGGMLGYALQRLRVEYRLSTNERRKKRFQGLFIAYCIGYLGSVDFLASLGVPLYTFGYLPVMAFLVIAAQVIMKYQLVDITPELAAGRILETMQGAVVVVDLEGKVRLINRAVQEMLGRGGAELIGKDLTAFLDIPPVLAGVTGISARGARSDVYRSSQNEPWSVVNIAASLLTDRKDAPVGIVYVAYDISERIHMENELKRMSQFRERVMHSTTNVIYAIDLEGRFTLVNNQATVITGYTARELIGSPFSVLLSAQSLPVVGNKFQSVLRGEAVTQFETEFIRKDRSVVTVTHSLSSLVENGRIVGVVGTAEDITQRKQTEEKLVRRNTELQQLNAELKALYDVSQAISRTLDIGELASELLRALVRTEIFPFEIRGAIFLAEGEEMRLASFLNIPEAEVGPCKTIQAGVCLCGRAMVTGEIVVSMDSTLDERHEPCVHGGEAHGHIIVPLKAVDKVVGLLSLNTRQGTEVSESLHKLLSALGGMIGIALNNARLYEETKTSSLHDHLTGLANRRFMQVQLEKNFSAAKRYDAMLSVIMIDIDHFKNYNDTHGHPQGDRLLAKLAAILLKETRSADSVFRYGGEEFLVLLPHTDLAKATLVAEKLRAAVEAEAGVTTSLGVAAYQKTILDQDALIKRADAALYRAKQGGRNRVEAASGDELEELIMDKHGIKSGERREE